MRVARLISSSSCRSHQYYHRSYCYYSNTNATSSVSLLSPIHHITRLLSSSSSSSLSTPSKSPSSSSSSPRKKFIPKVNVTKQQQPINSNDTATKHTLTMSDVLSALNDNIAGHSNDVVNAIKAFTMIDKAGIKPDINSYNHLLKSYANTISTNSNNSNNNYANDALEYYNKMTQQKIKPNYITYSAIIEIVLQSNDYDKNKNDNITPKQLNEALNYFNLCEKTGRYLDKKAFDLLFDRLVNDNEELALSLIKRHVNDKTKFQFAHWLLVLLTRHLMKRSNSAYEIFELMMKYKVYPSFNQVVNIFQSISESDDIDRATRYWVILKKNNYRHLYDTHLINIIVNIFKNFNSYKDAIKFYEIIIEDKEYRPNKILTAVIINLHGQIGDYIGAVKYFDYYLYETKSILSSQSLPVVSSSSMIKNSPDLVLFNALIDAHANSKNVNGAMYYYNVMITDYAIKPDIVTYTSIMKAYELSGDTKNINNIFDTMIKSNIVINIQTIDTIIRAYAKVGNLSEALRYFDMLDDYDLKPTSYTLSAVICAYAYVKDKEGVAKYFMMMYETYKLQPHISMINGILMTWIGYDNKFTFDDIDEILKFVDILNLQKDSHIYYQLLLACKIKNDISRAYTIFDEILTRPDIGTPEILCNSMKAIIGSTNFDNKYDDLINKTAD